MLKYLFLILFSPCLVFADVTISPSPSSGVINLDTASPTISFSNPTSTPISLDFSLSQSGSAFSLSIDRCSGKILTQNTSCYVIVSINNSLLSSGINSADFKNGASTLFSVKRTKTLPTGSPAAFQITSLSINDFLARTLVIKNNSLSVQTYSFSLSGTDASKFSIVSNQCQNVASGKSCSVSLKLRPQQAGSYSVILSDSLIGNSVSISSTITSLTPNVIPSTASSVSVSPSTLSFGTLNKFKPSYAQNIVVTNNGNSIITPIITASSSMKIILNRCASLSPAQTCSVSVAMNPIYQTDINGQFSGSISIKATSSSTAILVSSSSTLSVPPALVAYNGEGGTCPSNQHFEGNICVSSSSGFTSCQEIKDATPSSVSGYFDLSVDGTPTSLYCDMSDASNAYLEIFDITREPSLTNAQIVQRINRFTNFTITESNIVRDSNNNVAWALDSSNSGLISGQSLGFEKISASKMKFFVHLGDDGQMGQMVLHSSNKTGCSAETSDSLGCYQTAFKYQSQIRLLMGDFGTSVKSFSYVNNGNTSSIFDPYDLETIIDNTPPSIFLTQAGRLENGINYANPHFFFKKLLIKGSIIDSNLYPKLSCAAAKASGITTSGYIQLDPDGPVGPIQPNWVYCNMSGSGVATITESCNYARIFGQKSINNDFASGSYQIDFDGNGSNPAANQYCDMTPTAWNNNEGGYTLVGVFKSNSSISASPNIADVSQENIYLNDATYQTLLSKSTEVILRSNRNNSSEVVMKIFTNIIPNLSCYKNDLSILPSNYTGNTPTNTATNMYWFWSEPGCSFSGGDYTTAGIIDSTHYIMFSMSSYYLYLYDWGAGQFLNNHGDIQAGGGSYSVPEKTSNESIYIYLK